MEKITFNQINTNTIEGRFLLAAIGKLTYDRTPEQCLEMLAETVNKIYGDSPLPKPEPRRSFEIELCQLLNRHNRESESNTPDFILATYVENALKAFELATKSREVWYGRDKKNNGIVMEGNDPIFMIGSGITT